MHHKPQHKRHRRFSERNQVLFLAGVLLVVVLGLLVAFLWWTNRPKLGSP
jgi:cell division septal protein FtsQ